MAALDQIFFFFLVWFGTKPRIGNEQAGQDVLRVVLAISNRTAPRASRRVDARVPRVRRWHRRSRILSRKCPTRLGRPAWSR